MLKSPVSHFTLHENVVDFYKNTLKSTYSKRIDSLFFQSCVKTLMNLMPSMWWKLRENRQLSESNITKKNIKTNFILFFPLDFGFAWYGFMYGLKLNMNAKLKRLFRWSAQVIAKSCINLPIHKLLFWDAISSKRYVMYFEWLLAIFANKSANCSVHRILWIKLFHMQK